ncbi:MAG: TIGR02757 family protein [Bacteroidota bacterium]
MINVRSIRSTLGSASNLIPLKNFLDEQVVRYNRPDFIQHDPIAIPHAYKNRRDIEIAGFLAATLAWGQRKVVIRKCRELLSMMDNVPYDFIVNHQTDDLKPLMRFKHRTFNATDALYFMHFLQQHYQQYDTLEVAFLAGLALGAHTIEGALVNFHRVFFSLVDYPERTRKHIPTPERNAACKRLNMFLRWMVRQDDQGVDFGLWRQIKPHQLVCPCDVHVTRVSRQLGLMQRKNTDWETALELTQNLKLLSPEDPVKYDFALFGLGLYNNAG